VAFQRFQRPSHRYIARGSSRRSWGRCRCTGCMLGRRLRGTRASRNTYEFESNAASFYAANCEVEEDTGALYHSSVLSVGCIVQPRSLRLTGVDHGEQVELLRRSSDSRKLAKVQERWAGKNASYVQASMWGEAEEIAPGTISCQNFPRSCLSAAPSPPCSSRNLRTVV
jgi:hypothetical protein